MTERNIRRRFLGVFLIIGMFAALFLLYEHFSPSANKFCTFGNSFDCGIVNKSPYANLDGISYLLTIDYKLPFPLINISGMNEFMNVLTSNAFLGFLTLLFLFLLNVNYKRERFLWVSKERNVVWIQRVLIFGVLYGLYLFYIQHSILQTYCIFCITLDIMMISSLITSYYINGEKK